MHTIVFPALIAVQLLYSSIINNQPTTEDSTLCPAIAMGTMQSMEKHGVNHDPTSLIIEYQQNREQIKRSSIRGYCLVTSFVCTQLSAEFADKRNTELAEGYAIDILREIKPYTVDIVANVLRTLRGNDNHMPRTEKLKLCFGVWLSAKSELDHKFDSSPLLLVNPDKLAYHVTANNDQSSIYKNRKDYQTYYDKAMYQFELRNIIKTVPQNIMVFTRSCGWTTPDDIRMVTTMAQKAGLSHDDISALQAALELR